MRANPRWWTLTKAERRARARATKEQQRTEKWGARVKRRELQGSPPAAPVVVPPELIWKANQMRPYERSQFPLNAYRDAKALEAAAPKDDPAD
jgi:hypothetical protein